MGDDAVFDPSIPEVLVTTIRGGTTDVREPVLAAILVSDRAH